MDKEKRDKDQTYWAVLNSAIELDFKRGHLKWTITELSKKSTVTRSLIYYYFGRSKIGILEAAVSVIGEEFTGVVESRVDLWEKGEFEKSLLEARKIYEETPYMCAFYLNYRQRDNDIGKQLVKVEKSFHRKIQTFAPKATEAEINTIFAVYFGITYAPNVGEEELKVFSQFIGSIFKKLR